MQFASLGGLWFALSLPFIVLLYMLKRRYTDTEVSSHLLWQRVLREQEANRPWQKLRRQLLLWLQLLAAALFVIALMQPYVQRQHSAKTHVIFVLDDSASMQASDDHRTRLDEVKTEMLEYAREHAPNSAYTLLVMKDQPEVLISRQNGVSSLQEALKQAGPFYGKTNYQEALSLASALSRDDRNAEVRVYTDGQWTEQASGVVFSVPVTVQKLSGTTAPANVSISQFGVKSIADGSAYQAVAALKNWSSSPISMKATAFIDSQAVHTDSIELKPGEQKSIFIDQLARGDVYKLQIDTKDAMEADNTAYAFPEGSGRIQAAYVGEGNLFLEKALALAKVDLLNVQKNASGAYPLPLGRKPDLILLDGVDEAAINGEGWKRLLASTPAWSIAPGSAAAIEEAAVLPYTIADHPITRYIHLQDVNVAGIQKRAARPWEKPIVQSAASPLMLAGMETGIPRLTFAFSLQHTDLVLRPEFPVLVQNAAAWLTQFRGGNLGRVVAGETKEIALHPETVKASWKHDSEGAVKDEISAAQNGITLQSRQIVPASPGLYQFAEYNQEGHLIQTRPLEVTMDPRESNINDQTEIKLSKKDDSQSIGQERVESLNHPIAPWIVVILLIMMLFEWEVYRRGLSV
ncbi:vWA domain-containing protein [Paenibacillus sedimenti]|uniref:BatA domain-containing protein n=1 Tax=Paenibacillus sedimenti TaxID=2770274 RepID=A0A926KJY9_9BACL|nr:BatA and WFA domain-containing protein [Paenibacillus sedimenti]MBD0379144.1 BatA domain-containing protein [Paenibacillus sedimenti]